MLFKHKSDLFSGTSMSPLNKLYASKLRTTALNSLTKLLQKFSVQTTVWILKKLQTKVIKHTFQRKQPVERKNYKQNVNWFIKHICQRKRGALTLQTKPLALNIIQ